MLVLHLHDFILLLFRLLYFPSLGLAPAERAHDEEDHLQPDADDSTKDWPQLEPVLEVGCVCRLVRLASLAMADRHLEE